MLNNWLIAAKNTDLNFYMFIAPIFAAIIFWKRSKFVSIGILLGIALYSAWFYWNKYAV